MSFENGVKVTSNYSLIGEMGPNVVWIDKPADEDGTGEIGSGGTGPSGPGGEGSETETGSGGIGEEDGGNIIIDPNNPEDPFDNIGDGVADAVK